MKENLSEPYNSSGSTYLINHQEVYNLEKYLYDNLVDAPFFRISFSLFLLLDSVNSIKMKNSPRIDKK